MASFEPLYAARIDLAEWEWDMLDAEAAACGMTREELIHEMFGEAIEMEARGMDALS